MFFHLHRLLQELNNIICWCSFSYVPSSSSFRGPQAFFTLRRNGTDDLWFSLFLIKANQADLSYYGGSLISSSKTKLGLEAHRWSHACAYMDGTNGLVLVYMNGRLVFNVTMNGTDFAFAGREVVFSGKLILGASLWQNSENSLGFSQSEASVANVNIYSRGLSETEMVAWTLGQDCSKGDLVGWSSSEWQHTGQVQTLTTEELCDETSNNLLPLPFPLLWQDCVATCPRLAPGGRLPKIGNLKEAEDFLAMLNRVLDVAEEGWVWAPWRFERQGEFVDVFTGEKIRSDLWVTNQPNGGPGQQCSGWWRSKKEVRGKKKWPDEETFAGGAGHLRHSLSTNSRHLCLPTFQVSHPSYERTL